MLVRVFYGFCLIAGLILSFVAEARLESKDPAALQESASVEIKSRLSPLVEKYCALSCEVTNVDSVLEESIPESEELGFESVTSTKSEESKFFIKSFTVDIQIEKSVSEAAKTKLNRIFSNNLKSFKTDFVINWIPIDNPEIGGVDVEEKLREELRDKMDSILQKSIGDFCPETCILSYIDISGRLMQTDENRTLSQKNLYESKDKSQAYFVNNITIHLTIDSKLKVADREKILNLIKAATSFVSPVTVSTEVIEFPESFTKQQERETLESKDPYGLEKLRQMLILFRELAGTKEIITSSETKSEKRESSESSTNSSTSSNSNNSSSLVTGEWFSKYGMASILGIIALIFIMMRWIGSSRDAKIMIDTMHRQESFTEKKQTHQESHKPTELSVSKPSVNVEDKYRLDKLRDEITEMLARSPEASKETFTRMLQEEGIEATARYVHIFGKLVIFELLSDPSLSRVLFDLSEYYQKSAFRFSTKEETELLNSLRTKLVANEIKTLSKKTVDAFQFLNRLDPSQIYTLILEEKPQVQGIVLTQLPSKVRHVVFNLFTGERRVSLMNELCKADAIPKEYLMNVAQVLLKKVTGRPEFDTQNLRSSEILLEFMEKSTLEEQRQIMHKLSEANPDAARAIKLKLVTIEMLPYLKDSRLLDLVLGLEREDLLAFLGGTQEKIKNLFLSRAPGELRESWIEDLENHAQADESRYGLVEMVILGKIRQMATSGQINILDINDRIFDFTSESKQTNEKRLKLASHHIIA